MKKILKIAAIFLFFSAFLVFLKIIFPAGSDNIKVCFEEDCFITETALTQEEKAKGLMFRENLEQNKGMLFVFNKEGEYSFWMKNTLIPLDIIWMNEYKEVVFISKNSRPCNTEDCLSISPGVDAKYVLELNAGTADNIGLSAGGKAVFDIK
ncbi:MAG: DUF192 domain-containing protein [Candidatus Parcubacteria bacterium]|nr:DUF192 domain-containing protein [Candidatus Parcubacteria bacterium]